MLFGRVGHVCVCENNFGVIPQASPTLGFCVCFETEPLVRSLLGCELRDPLVSTSQMMGE